jgi:uncharacterized protein (DUF58 family)
VASLGLGAVLLGVGAQWRYPGVFGLGCALLVPALLAIVSVLTHPPVRAHRTVRPLEVTRYEACSATLRIQGSGGRFPMAVDIVEQVAGQPLPIRVPRPAGAQATEVGYQIPTQRRGVLKIGPLRVYRRAVAGLAESRAALGGVEYVRVLPRVLPVRGMPGGVRRGHSGSDERVARGGTDLVGLRDYVPGDDLRRLHWATSARAGRLMVREDADPATAQLTVLLDDRAGSYPGEDLEDAVEVAASLAVAAAEGGHGVRLLTVCGQLDVEVPASPAMPTGAPARDLVSALADVAARRSDAAPAPVPVSARDVVVVVTGARAEPGALVAEAARGALGVVAILDPAGLSTVDGGAVGAGGVVGAGEAVGAVGAVGAVTVLRGGQCREILDRWDTAVVG